MMKLPVCFLMMTAFTVTSLSMPVFAADFTAAQKKDIEAIVKQYLLDNPEIIFQAAENHQRNEQAKADVQAKDVLKNRSADLFDNALAPMLGSPMAKTAFVEFFDYECGYCKQAFSGLSKLVNDNKDIKILLVDTPILSENSYNAARWALAAGKQGKYLAYHAALMEFKGPKTIENLEKLATQIGLDSGKMKIDADGAEVKAQLEKNMELFKALGLNGTPGFAARDRVIRGYVGPEVLAQIAKEIQTSGASKK
jgi:protein-disulfide isomerase